MENQQSLLPISSQKELKLEKNSMKTDETKKNHHEITISKEICSSKKLDKSKSKNLNQTSNLFRSDSIYEDKMNESKKIIINLLLSGFYPCFYINHKDENISNTIYLKRRFIFSIH